MKIVEETYQKQLLLRLNHGDESAFKELYKAYSKPLYLRILRMVKNAEETAAILKQAIEHLPPQRKKVFQLCKIEGKSYKEAGPIMGISIATVNRHMTKSIQSIREYSLKHQDVAILIMTTYAVSGILK